MQRLASSTRATADEYYITISPSQMKPPSRKKQVDEDYELLPISVTCLNAGKKDISHSKSPIISEKWVHVIPLILLTCVFILWWFSHPVNVMVKEDKIVSISQIEWQPTNQTEWKQTAFAAFAKLEMLVESKLFSNNGA